MDESKFDLEWVGAFRRLGRREQIFCQCQRAAFAKPAGLPKRNAAGECRIAGYRLSESPPQPGKSISPGSAQAASTTGTAVAVCESTMDVVVAADASRSLAMRAPKSRLSRIAPL